MDNHILRQYEVALKLDDDDKRYHYFDYNSFPESAEEEQVVLA